MCKNDREGHSLTPTDTPGWSGKRSPATQEPSKQFASEKKEKKNKKINKQKHCPKQFPVSCSDSKVMELDA